MSCRVLVILLWIQAFDVAQRCVPIHPLTPRLPLMFLCPQDNLAAQGDFGPGFWPQLCQA